MLRKLLLILLSTLSIAISAHALEADDTVNQIMVISDIHLDPLADCQNQKPCPLAMQLNKSNAGQWPQILAQYNHNVLPLNGENTNYTLFRSLLEQIELQKPQNLFILGDFLAHRFRTKYVQYTQDTNREHFEKFVQNTMQYMATALQQVMPPSGAIYSLIGNHDSYKGKDCAYDDYCVIPDGSFYQVISKQWAPLFRDEVNRNLFMNTFTHNGYYHVLIPRTRDHILVLNTVLFSTKAQGPGLYKNAQEQLQWLQQQLETISKAQEKTWILYHIPPAIDAYSSAKNFFGVVMPFWDQNYVKSFSDIIKKYNTTVTGVLSGHTHMDGFLVLNNNTGNIIVDTFVASISPIFGNNPSYKIYSYKNNNFEIHDFGTYYLNLRDNKGSKDWEKEYQFSSIYTPDDGLFTGYKKITANKNSSYSSNYIRFYGVNTLSQPIIHGKWNYYWCATACLNTKKYENCVKHSNLNACDSRGAIS